MYRLYFINTYGQVGRAANFEAENDAAALQRAATQNGYQTELWRGQKLVANSIFSHRIRPRSASNYT